MHRLCLFLLIIPLLYSCRKRNILTPKADREGIVHYQIKSKTLDPGIVQDRFPNHLYVAPEVTQRDLLLVFLGATNSAPHDYEEFPRQAARMGYHVINMNYSNSPSVNLCTGEGNEECFERMREEVQTGRRTSNRIFVNEVHSIENRLLKLLQYMADLDPGMGWEQYFNGDDLRYHKMVIAGHSQGAGQAAYIGKKNEVERVIMFSGPNDYSEFFKDAAAWAEGFFETDRERYFVLAHLEDEVLPFAQQYAFWHRLGLTALGDTTLVGEQNVPSSNPQMLYTQLKPGASSFSLGRYHNSVVVDRYLRREKGEVVLEGIWEYLLN